MGKVIVAGSIITDMSVKVNEHPKVGETVIGRNLSYSPGGKGANQAVASSKLGSDTVMFGAIGRDSFGEMSIDFLLENGIVNATIFSDKPTGIAMIQVSEKTANNSIVVILGANEDLTPDDLEYNFHTDIEEGDVLVSQFEIPLDTIKAFFEKGREVGTINILNPAPAERIPLDLLNLVDILIVNETELETISGQEIHDDVEIVVAIHELQKHLKSDPIVIVTLGERGVLGKISEEGKTKTVILPGIEVKAIDTTGAGDCFVGAVAMRCAEERIETKEQLREVLNYANNAAACSVTKKGSGIAMPTKEDVDYFMVEP